MNKWLFILFAIALAVIGFLNREAISDWVAQKSAVMTRTAETPAPVAAPALPVTPNPAKAAIDQARLAYPALARAGSAFNLKFVALYNDAKARNPDFLAQPKWPLLLAERTAKELGGGAMPLAGTQHSVRPAVWTENYASALETAKAENKKLLLDFTGSDWCGYCQALDREVLNTAKFKAWAGENVVLVKVDFPQSLPQSSVVKTQNAQLKSKYPFDGYPTVLVVDTTGHVLSRSSGYNPGSGPEAYIATLEGRLRH